VAEVARIRENAPYKARSPLQRFLPAGADFAVDFGGIAPLEIIY